MAETPGKFELRVTCPQCGSQQADGTRFCAKCGASLAGVLPIPAGFDEALLAKSDLAGRVLSGKYRLVEKVGEGGMGTVYKAEHKVLGRVVAVKILHPEMVYDESAVARFKAEAKAASRLNHPNVISVMDFGQTPDGLFFLVTEFLHGLPLSRLLETGDPLDPYLSYVVITQALSGMQQAHDLGIVHRDLKPENIFLERFSDGSLVVKVLDFGVAKDLQDQGPGLTSPGMVCGTPEYMSPEQAMGKLVDPRTDVYALGLVLFEMLAGANPFERSSPAESMIAHVRDKAPTLSSVARHLPKPDLIDAVVAMAIAKDPAQRYPDARAFLKELRTWGKAAGMEFGRDETAPPIEWPEEFEEPSAADEGVPERPPSTRDSEPVANSGTQAILALLEAESPSRLHLEDEPQSRNFASGSAVLDETVPLTGDIAPGRDVSGELEIGELVGRRELLSEILDALIVAGRARVVSPPGMGKSAVLEQLSVHWRSKGWQVFTVMSIGFTNPSAPLAPILRILEEIRKGPIDAWRNLSPLDRKVLNALLDTGMPVAGSQTDAGLRELEASWLNLLALLEETSLIIVDDFHRLDPPSRRLAEAAEDAVSKGRIACSVVTACEEDCSRGDAPHFELPPLGPGEKNGLAQRLLAQLGDETGLHKVIKIPEAASGNPFFIEQAVRASLEGNLPRRSITTPMDILDSRLSRLPNAARWVLQVTCLIDEPVSEGDIAPIMDQLVREWETGPDRLDLAECLLDLERRGLVARKDGKWQPTHEIISQAVVNLAPVEFRRRTHDLLAQRAADMISEPPSCATCRAARHVIAAEADDPASLALCMQAGAYARACGDPKEASRDLGFLVDRLHRKWAQGGIGDKDLVCRIGTAARVLAACLVDAGDAQAAQAILGETLIVVRSEGLDHLAAGILMDLADRDLALGQVESGVTELAEALEFVAGRHWYLDAQVSMRLGELLARRGRFESALERYADAAVAAGTNPGQGNALLWEVPLSLAQLHEGWGRAQQAHDFAQQALLSADEQADLVGRMKSHSLLARLESTAQHWDRMRTHAEAVHELALDLPDRRRAAEAALQAAMAWRRLGSKEQARRSASLAKKLALEMGDEHTAVRATGFLTRLEKQ